MPTVNQDQSKKELDSYFFFPPSQGENVVALHLRSSIIIEPLLYMNKVVEIGQLTNQYTKDKNWVCVSVTTVVEFQGAACEIQKIITPK